MDAEWLLVAATGGIVSVLPYLGVALADWLLALRQR